MIRTLAPAEICKNNVQLYEFENPTKKKSLSNHICSPATGKSSRALGYNWDSNKQSGPCLSVCYQIVQIFHLHLLTKEGLQTLCSSCMQNLSNSLFLVYVVEDEWKNVWEFSNDLVQTVTFNWYKSGPVRASLNCLIFGLKNNQTLTIL